MLTLCVLVEAHSLYFYTLNNMNKMSPLDWIALVLVLIGALNWGLIGIFNFNLVSTLFGDMSTLSRTVYIVVGVSAVYVAGMSIAKES